MFTLYSADFINAPSNCSYPHKTEVRDAADLAAAVSRDHVCAEYMNHYRNGENFLGSDCLPVDCDNDHSENPADWVTPADVQAAFPGITFAVHYSRFHMREKNGKPARPKFHVLFPMKKLAKDKMLRALSDQRYASTVYEQEMTQDALLKAVQKN